MILCKIIIKKKSLIYCNSIFYTLFLPKKMSSKKLTTFLATFSKKEINRFCKFVRSPYHNEREELVIFIEQIKPSLTSKSQKETPSKEIIWEKIYPSTPYNDLKIRKLSSLLLNLAIEFKSLEILNTEENLQQKLLLNLKAVSHPALTTHIAAINRKLNSINQQLGVNTIVSNFYNFQFNIQNHHLLEINKDWKKLAKFSYLQKAYEHLNIFYLSQKLEIATTALSFQSFINTKDFAVQKNLLPEAQKSPYLDKPIVHAYYLILLLLTFPEDPRHYNNLKEWLNNTSFNFSPTQEKNFYDHLLSYCISQRINKGDTNFIPEAFFILQTMVKKRLIFSPYLDPSYYRNIITIGSRLGEYDYITDFIAQYSDELPPDQKENVALYNLARIHFVKEEYGKVLELLHNVEFSNHSYAVGAKAILIGTYYALEEYRVLDSLLRSFRVFILRNQLFSRETKQGYLNFIRFTKKLMNLPPYSKESRIKLKNKINQTENVGSRDWLLKQLD